MLKLAINECNQLIAEENKWGSGGDGSARIPLTACPDVNMAASFSGWHLMKLGYGCVRSQVMKYRPCLDMQAYTTKCHGSVIKEDLKHVLVLNFDKPNESLIALENLCKSQGMAVCYTPRDVCEEEPHGTRRNTNLVMIIDIQLKPWQKMRENPLVKVVLLYCAPVWSVHYRWRITIDYTFIVKRVCSIDCLIYGQTNGECSSVCWGLALSRDHN